MADDDRITSIPATADTVDMLVKIAGRKLDPEIAANLLDVSVHQTLNATAHVTLRFAAWDSDSEELTWVDDPMFAPGRSVEIELGYLNLRKSVFWGEIVGLDLAASTSERAVLTVHAFDLLHRLGRGQRDDQYEKASFADVVRKIAELHGLSADVDDDPQADPKNPILYQRDTSDLAYVTELARKLEYDLFVDVDSRKLVFRKPPVPDPHPPMLKATEDLIQFTAASDASGQLGRVEVRTLESNTKNKIDISIDNPDSQDRAFGSARSRSVITSGSLASTAEATARANAELLRIRRTYLKASTTCFGRTDLKPGLTVELVGLGRRFDGAYYVTAATHALSSGGGYRTSLELEGTLR